MDERSGDPGEFMSHPRWHRFLIAVAGPSMNILFAVGMLTFVYMVRYEYPAVLDEPAIIGWVAQTRPQPRPEFRSATASSALTASRIRPGSR